MSNLNNILPVIVGPTASGKTHLAVNLAKELNGEIISADSRQVYQRMDIGTGKDLDEYSINGESIPYHLINICKPGDKYNINLFYHDFVKSLGKIKSNNNTPILCGGSGLYLQTALEGNELSAIPVNNALRNQLKLNSKEELQVLFEELSDKLKSKLDSNSNKRVIRALEIGEFLEKNPYPQFHKPTFTPILFGIDIPREQRRNRISIRLKNRLANGMIEEVEELLNSTSAQDLKYYGLEYLYLVEFLENKHTYEELFQKLEIAIHQFSKRQMTWFRKMEKEGYKINWIDWSLPTIEKTNYVLSKLK
jgi:tRNA dimethylallyltransferase